MELFLILLAIELVSSDKLDRAYLPPPGAKYAGGNSNDLQTPLEYPKMDPSFEKENNGNIFFGGVKSHDSDYTDEVFGNYDIDKTVGKDILQIENESHNGYTYTTVNPDSNINTFSEIGYKIPETQNSLPGFGYPYRPLLQENGTTNYFEAAGNFRKPGSLPVIAVPEKIIQTYHSNAFGMYGGKPMIIKSQPEPQAQPNVLGDHSGNYHDQNSSILYTSDGNIVSGFQISDLTKVSSAASYSSEPKIGPAKIDIISNLNQRNYARNAHQKKPENPQTKSDRNADSINYKNKITPKGYSYSLDTSNGIHTDESATTVNGVKALGSYSYTGDDGKVYSVMYSADEKGFQPRGDHLPTPPPIPTAIKMVIEQAKKDKEAGIFHDGSYDEEKYGHMKYQGPVNRYLLKIQDNLELKKRDRAFNRKKTYKKHKFTQVNEYQAAEKNIGRAKAIFNPFTAFNGLFGMKKFSSIERPRTETIKNLNIENALYHRQPVKVHQKENLKQKLDFRPNTADLDKLRNVFKNKDNHRTTFIRNENADKLDLINTANGSTNRYKDLSLEIDEKGNLFKNTYSYPGYFYVPPREVFIEGRFQDKSTIIKEAPKNDKNIETKSINVSGFYYVDQRYNVDKYHEKSNPLMASYFTSTVEPDIYQHTYDSHLHESTIQDVDQSKHNLETVSTISSNDIIITITTPKPYGNTTSTNFQDLNSMEDTVNQEDTILHDDNDVPRARAGLDNTCLSTTPMALEEKYTLSDTNQYEKSNSEEFDSSLYNANYSEYEGYLRIKPNKPATFEDVPTSTYTYLADNGIQTDSIQNINVDGFGKPNQDYELFNTTPIYEYFTAEPVSNAANFSNNFESSLAETSDEQIFSEVSDKVGFGLQQEKSTKDKNTVDKVIGEDFSGPKQPERFDPESGYFY